MLPTKIHVKLPTSYRFALQPMLQAKYSLYIIYQNIFFKF